MRLKAFSVLEFNSFTPKPFKTLTWFIVYPRITFDGDKKELEERCRVLNEISSYFIQGLDVDPYQLLRFITNGEINK